MIRALSAGVLACSALSFCALAQSGNRGTGFEVASIRPISRDELLAKNGFGAYNGLTISPQRVSIGGLQMSALLSIAFRINPRLIVGVPVALDTLFSIEAVMPYGTTKDHLPEMLRTLLEERFHLKTHFQTMDQRGYALVSGKGAPQLKRPQEIDLSSCNPWVDRPNIPGSKQCISRSSDKTIAAYTDSEWGPIETLSSRGMIRDEYFRASMTVLASSLATHISNQSSAFDNSLYVPVVDETGISGEWDVVLERADPLAGGPAMLRDARQSYDPVESYSSALAKAGLRLQKTSVRINKLVIDHVDTLPTEN